MRLLRLEALSTRRERIVFQEFLGSAIPPYAILSHTWGKDEVTFDDVESGEYVHQMGMAKIRGCFKQAEEDRIQWIWIDTCCINKSSSAELSEAINSMYAWYRSAARCYALLSDIPTRSVTELDDEFQQARWFTRGWCLQELIAPKDLEFYSADWMDIGTKWSMHDLIEDMTGIPADLLLGKTTVASYSIAERMSWASERNTTRLEDKAYCLLGLFEISMPLLYGEGERSFIRLQEEILRQTEDYTILLWASCNKKDYDEHQSDTACASMGVLALSPAAFPKGGVFASCCKYCDYGSIEPFAVARNITSPPLGHSKVPDHWDPPQMTSRGLRVHMPIRKDPASETSLLLWTRCTYERRFVCIRLRLHNTRGFPIYGRIDKCPIDLEDATALDSFELSSLYLSTAITCLDSLTASKQPLQSTQCFITLKSTCLLRLILVDSSPQIGNCPHFDRATFWDVQEHEKISLKFRVVGLISSQTVAEIFTVLFGLRQNGQPWCEIRHISSSLASEKFSEGDNEGVGDSFIHHSEEIDGEQVITDRALCQLSTGHVVHVAAKRSIGSEHSDWCFLHVTLHEPASKEENSKHLKRKASELSTSDSEDSQLSPSSHYASE